MAESEYEVMAESEQRVNVLDIRNRVDNESKNIWLEEIKRYLFSAMLAVAVLTLILSKSLCVMAANNDQKKILYLSSYSYAWAAVQQQIQGIQDEFEEDEYFLDYEFMDTKKIGDEVAIENFYRFLSYKMENIPTYDLIIAGDDAALSFCMEHQGDLFQDIPIVFEGVNNEILRSKAEACDNITGIYQEFSMKENIELGRKMFPDAQKVVAILDNSPTGQAEAEKLYECEHFFTDLQFEILNGSELTEKEIIHQLKILRKNDIVIYIVMSENVDGKKYSDDECIKLITKYSDAPVFRMIDTGLEQGLLGGYVVSMENTGQEAASMAKSILHGKQADDIKVKKCTGIYKINEMVALDHKIDLDVFPEETEFFNHKLSIYEENESWLRKLVPFSIVMAVVIGIIVYDNVKKRKIMKELQEARNIMEDASHHDFLTGLPNRSKFVSDLQAIMDEQRPCTVLMLDIDDFKKINDNLGHSAGDEALREIAARMKAMQTNILTPYRYAGDEFIMILKSEQQNLIEKTAFASSRVFADKVLLAGEKRVVTGSIGIASYPKDADSMELLITCADDAMYEVKKSGKNKFSYYKGERKETVAKENI